MFRFLLASLLLTGFTAGRFGPEPDVELHKRAARNVVLFVADDHGQDTGAYGNPVVQTPNLDALAEDGVLFVNAFATTASCSASRSVILSGMHNHRTAQYGHTHDYHHFQSWSNIKGLPVLMSEGGYRTLAIGKYHVAPEETYQFDERLSGNTRNPVQMAEEVRDFISSDEEAPFFLYFATSDPHRGADLPFDSAGVIVDGQEYPTNSFGNQPEGYEGVTEVIYDPDDVIVPPYLTDTPETRAELAQYYQSISRIDTGFGRLVEILKAAGVYDETLILYISDHGAAFPGAKTTVYEPGLKSPLIVRNPYDEARGHTSQAMVSWVDLTPTILDFAGVEPPVYEGQITTPVMRDQVPEEHGLHGQSFLPVLGEENPEGWDEVYASHTFHEIQMYYPMRVVRDRQYKLIWNIAYPLPYPFATDLWAASSWQSVYKQGPEALYGPRKVRDYIQRPQFELFDVSVDPYESHNLADDPRYAEVLERYKQKLRTFQQQTSDPWLIKWQYE